jgi:uncharacterized protein with HEPN domain
MADNKRDVGILHRIVEYCNRLAEHHQTHNAKLDYEVFRVDHMYSDAVAFCIFQIAELCVHLSDECRALSPEIPWKNIRGMRNIVAHNYGEIKLETLWNTSVERTPELSISCTRLISKFTGENLEVSAKE